MFEKCVAFVLLQEGGYINDPRDPGGETNFGISKKAYPEVDIKGLTKQSAIDIYKRDYWDVLDRRTNGKMPGAVMFQMFDLSVNGGLSRAVKVLQDALGVSEMDGVIGQNTMDAVLEADASRLAVGYMVARFNFYAGLSAFSRFGKGWTRRAASALAAGLQV